MPKKTPPKPAMKPSLLSRVKSAASRASSKVSSSNADSISMAASIAKSLGLNEKTGERIWESFKLVAVVLPPIVAVIAISTLMIVQATNALVTSNKMTLYLHQSTRISDLINSLRRERDFTCIVFTRTDTHQDIVNVKGEGSSGTNDVDARLTQLRNETDVAVRAMAETWSSLVTLQSPEERGLGLNDADTFAYTLSSYRKRVGQTEGGGGVGSCTENVDFYTPRIECLMNNIARVFYESNEGEFWGALNAVRFTMQAAETMGNKREGGSPYFADGYYKSVEMREMLLYNQGATTRLMDQAAASNTLAKRYLDKMFIDNATVFEKIENLTVQALANVSFTSGDRSWEWFELLTTERTLRVEGTRDLLIGSMLERIEAADVSSNSLLASAASIVAVALLLSIPITIYYAIKSYQLNKQVRAKMAELNQEKVKSERILFQMMPMKIVKDLQAGRTVAPKMFSECTVYFSDIKGFTTISQTSTPLEVVNMLNSLYTTMDTVLDQYRVYKVETIGDAYMVVSGIPMQIGADHSAEVCTMALHMLQEVASIKIPHRPSETLRMRIGINSGPGAAGIVGLRMPRYCLFGDTVNTASRMESTGLPMRVQLSHNTNNHLIDHHSDLGFTTKLRGELDIKGKGVQRTYWLVSRADFPFHVDLSGDDPAFPEENK